MKSLKSCVVLFCSFLLSVSAFADQTRTANSPEAVVPRISAKKYDVKVGIFYTEGDDKKGSTSPTFFIGKHKVKPGEGNRAVLGVEIPANAKLVGVRGLMRNEPWGGAQKPPKANTDDMGTVDYKACPLGAGDCPIGWSDVSPYIDTVAPDGRRYVSAAFRNWVGRNDRTAMLEVTYTVPD
ncbi:hypothetical protein [Herbaspirillum sp. RV1423]|uniref:hypothetical protein n=1 Tax=Herbaspirillum sp. RV1423 TaxID=1443993 RepID=UPI0012DCDC71|nr:hypothetical protein [Herbaspirillum sp. RV1423]